MQLGLTAWGARDKEDVRTLGEGPEHFGYGSPKGLKVNVVSPSRPQEGDSEALKAELQQASRHLILDWGQMQCHPMQPSTSLL